MQIRKFFRKAYSTIVIALCVLLVIAPSRGQDFHYGVRTDTFQPIHRLGNWLWYSHLHTQIPSLEKKPELLLVSAGTGARGVLTPYFALGLYLGGSQLHTHSSKSYTVSPGVECYFPWAKLGIHSYFMWHLVDAKIAERADKEAKRTHHAVDIKLSGTFLPFVRPFFSTYYLARSTLQATHPIGSLHFHWGIEWLMAPRLSVELKHVINEGSFWIALKAHSAKVYKPSPNPRVIHYLKEPVDQYNVPLQYLGFDASRLVVAQSTSTKSGESVAPPPSWRCYGRRLSDTGAGKPSLDSQPLTNLQRSRARSLDESSARRILPQDKLPNRATVEPVSLNRSNTVSYPDRPNQNLPVELDGTSNASPCTPLNHQAAKSVATQALVDLDSKTVSSLPKTKPTTLSFREIFKAKPPIPAKGPLINLAEDALMVQHPAPEAMQAKAANSSRVAQPTHIERSNSSYGQPISVTPNASTSGSTMSAPDRPTSRAKRFTPTPFDSSQSNVKSARGLTPYIIPQSKGTGVRGIPSRPLGSSAAMTAQSTNTPVSKSFNPSRNKPATTVNTNTSPSQRGIRPNSILSPDAPAYSSSKR